MMFPYARDGQRLVRLSGQDDLATALWIDLYRPQPHQVQAVRALGFRSIPASVIPTD